MLEKLISILNNSFFFVISTPIILLLIWLIWKHYINEVVIANNCRKEVEETLKISKFKKQKDYEIFYYNCLLNKGSLKVSYK